MITKTNFIEIMNSQTEMALATSANNIPNVRIINFYFDTNTNTIFFTSFKKNKKIKDKNKDIKRRAVFIFRSIMTKKVPVLIRRVLWLSAHSSVLLMFDFSFSFLCLIFFYFFSGYVYQIINLDVICLSLSCDLFPILDIIYFSNRI